MDRTYTVVLLHERDGRYSAVAPALECASWGHTVPEALRMVEEALACHLNSLERHGDPIPDDTDTFTVEMGDATDAVIYRVTVRDREAERDATVTPDDEGADLPPGVLRSILRQAGLTVEEFTDLLR